MSSRTGAAAALLLLVACGDAMPAGSDGDSTSTSTSTSASPSTTSTTTGLEPTTTSSTTSTASTAAPTTSTSTGGPPVGCDAPPPCRTCTCEDDVFHCHCPELSPEAGYLDVAGVAYEIGEGDHVIAMTSSSARLFYSFHPAADDPGDAPLLVLFNGGPGVSTGLILAGNTGPQTLTDALEPAPSPAPWTALGHLLYIDARNTGFSQQSIADPSPVAARSAELTTRNFNSYLDAADFARALLRFWDDHPELADRRLVLVGESYGGIRASILLHMLLFPARYQDGPGRYRDPDLAAAVAGHLAARFPGDGPPDPAVVAGALGNLVLVQPSLAGSAQQARAGDLLEAPGSPVHVLSDSIGLEFVPCAAKPDPCDPWTNAINFVESAGRSRYDIAGPGTWLADLFARTRAGLSRRDTLAAILQVAPEGIEGLAAADRPTAFRVRNPGDYVGDDDAGDLPDHLGGLPEWDRYYLPFSVEALDGFRGPVAIMAGVHSSDPHYGALFLHDLAYARVFITDAARDLAIWGPSIAPTLEIFSGIVDAAEHVADLPDGAERPGELHVQFRPDAFPGEPDPGLRTIRLPPYDASHAVTYDQPQALRADLAAWLAEAP
ncbi:S10 family peptidase [Nannocystis pusilla]|uniref:S10 family peptidase n=1 Tax=Nannocystis pusilla TaxID=889268 RepID=A0ABS7TQA6_9BACT|nr:S10 family peptidase [Nannocystis pusilla]MBZ5710409.1 S10 family peptidase [Nannocystis pusilla]